MESDLKSARSISESRDWCGIGEDIWMEEIFKKLPIKSVGRSRCVCKAWNSLISSPFCIATRMSRYSSSSSSMPPAPYPSLLLFNGPSILLNAPSFAIYHHHPQEAETIKYSRLPFRFTLSNMDFELVDVINGVLCFSYSISSSFDSTLLWNPAICRYVAIQRKESSEAEKALDLDLDRTRRRMSTDWSALLDNCFQSNAIGFGYKNSDNDFKVVRVWIPSSTSTLITIRYEVFSSQTGLWSDGTATKDSAGPCGFITPTGCFFNGMIYWILSTSSHSLSLLMFDCERRELITSALPESFNLVKDRRAKLFRYSGMLTVLLRVEGKYELWVNNNKGHTTWNKLFRGDFSYDIHRCLVMMSRDDQPLNGYVYEESMFFMDRTKGVKSYAKGEAVDVIKLLNTRRCPPLNWIKLSTHAATRGARHLAGLGGVFTDDRGRFVRAFAFKGKRVKSALDAQLRGLWEGLRLAVDMGIHSLIVEMDAVLLIQAVTTSKYETEQEQPFSGLLFQCKNLIKASRWRVAICYVPTELNTVANWFAKTGKNHDAEFPVLFDDSPYEVEQLLANETTTKCRRE